MRYLHRDATGQLLGHYANPQPGYAEEQVEDNHPDILAWNRKIELRLLHAKALRAIEHQRRLDRLEQELNNPNAPPEVQAYSAALRRQE